MLRVKTLTQRILNSQHYLSYIQFKNMAVAAKQDAFDVKEFINKLDKNYEFEIHKLTGFAFDDTHKNVNREHYVICIHHFLSSTESTLYQKDTRKLCDKDLMKHGNRRHALYFNIKDSGLNKQFYRYGKKDWPMSNGIPDIMQNKLLDKLYKQFGIMMNGIVYNVYTSKKSHIWWHTDLQPGIGDIICTFSTGRSEYLQFRPMHKRVVRGKDVEKIIDENKENREINEEIAVKENECILSVKCDHGTLIIMTPGVNEYYQHRVAMPTENQINEAIEKFGCIDRENTTMHFHFDESKYDNYLNLASDSALSLILNNL